MTKMAAMAINRKKTFFYRTRRPIILKLGMNHQEMELYKVCINHDPGMTLTFLRQGKLRSYMHLDGKKNRKMSTNSKKLARNEQMDRIFMFMKIFWSQSVVCPCLEAIYIHVYDHNIQTSSSLKTLGQSKPNFIWSIFRKSE